jgi:hypothetical protein
MEPVTVQAPYRAAWVRVFRQFSFARLVHIPVVVALLASFWDRFPYASLRPVLWGGLLLSMAARILIFCPRCKALWPISTDDDGRRKPCKRCGLRWGQEEEDPSALEPMDPNAF